MNKFFENEYFHFVLRISFGLFFIYASLDKISQPAEFALAIRAYEIIPDNLSNLPAIFLPWVELLCGLLLLSGLYIQSTLRISIGLLLIFTVNILIALLRGLEIDCGCGVSISGVAKVSWKKLLENLCLIILLILLSKQSTFTFSFQNKFSKK